MSDLITYRALWLELHVYAANNRDAWNEAEAKAWYRNWTARIPSEACDCQSHWIDLVRQNKADFSSAEAFFWWTVDRHNNVNTMLQKPKFTREQASELYGMPITSLWVL
jgi:hypothetical protein